MAAMDHGSLLYSASSAKYLTSTPLDSTSTSRTIQFHHKTRSGCATCKKRHVKCDETKPFCRKCVTTKRHCEGYAQNPAPLIPMSGTMIISSAFTSPTTTTASDTNIAPPHETSRVSIKAPLRMPLSRGEPSDLRALQFFRERTAPTLGAYTTFEQKFWSGLVPQMAESEPALRHIVIALASRQELVDHGSNEVLRLSHLQGRHYAESLRELNSATVAAIEVNKVPGPMANITHDGKGSGIAVTNTTTTIPRPIVILLSSVLYLAFESFQDPNKQTTGGLVHYFYGLKVLKEELINSNTTSSRQSDENKLLFSFVQPMFTRLQVVLSIFILPKANKLAVIRPIIDPKQPLMPSRFTDLHQARSLFVDICRWRYRKESTLEPWNVRSKAFHETRFLFLNWYRLLMAYQDKLSLKPNRERTRVTAMIAQYRFLFLSVIWSARDDLHDPDGLTPTEVDLSVSDAVSVLFVLSPTAMNAFVNEEQVPDPLEVRIWPVLKLASREDGNGTIRLTFKV